MWFIWHYLKITKAFFCHTIFLAKLQFTVLHDCFFALQGFFSDSITDLDEVVFCYQNCSDLLWESYPSDWEKLLKFEAEGREFAKISRSLASVLARTIFSNSQRSEQFGNRMLFLLCSLRFLISDIRIQIRKSYWDLETCRKS